MTFIWARGNNGNVYGITNDKDPTRSQTFAYDALNRLISAQNAGTDCTQTILGGNKKFWANMYSYDAWGTAERDGNIVRVQTVDTRADGVTPTTREADAAARIRSQQQPGDHTVLIPKGH